MDLISYENVVQAISGVRTHLLIGNGFSVACDQKFSYGKLLDLAIRAGLSERAQKVFSKLGTNNFEAVMRLLADGHWLAGNYNLLPDLSASEMLQDLGIIKMTLVKAVADGHPEHSGSVAPAKKTACAAFFKPYFNIFCTNYDLLTCWVNMYAGTPPPFEDGFRTDPEDQEAEALLFAAHPRERPAIFYIHGALHLFVGKRGIRKHSYIRSGEKLTGLIQNGFTEGVYPLFVAEGEAEKKLQQIQGNGYLSACFSKLSRVQNTLVVFGFSFGDSDQHIADVLAENTEIDRLYVGIFGDPKATNNQLIWDATQRVLEKRKKILGKRKRSKSLRDLEVFYFDSSSARVWG